MSTAPTPAQLARARDLMRRVVARENRVATLSQLIAATRAAHEANYEARRLRISFRDKPELLAGAAELYRRNGREVRQAMDIQYQWLMALIKDGTKETKPLEVDYDALPKAARPYLLAPYLGLVAGRSYPRLDFLKSEPAKGRLVYLCPNAPADAQAWRSQLPAINAWLGDHWELTASTATTITLERRTPLPAMIPFEARYLKPGHLFVGIEVSTRQPYYVPLAELAHTLIPGTTGMGKSVALDSLLRSLLASPASIEHIYAVDPAGIAFRKYRGVSPKLSTLSKPEDLWAVTAGLVETMKARETELEATGRAKFTDRLIFLIVDEFPAYSTPDTTDKKSEEWKSHQAFIGHHVMALGRRARKAGIKLIFVVQEPTERDISTGVRSVLPGVLSFRLPLLAHATAIFGELESLPADPRTLPRGRAIYRDGTSGETVNVQFPVFPASPSTNKPAR